MIFSVIVPLYNKAPYVEKTLRSVLCQTFTDYELVVVNDGSTDGSLIVAKSVLAGTDAIVIDQKNAGVSVARNNGVAASKGDYICFLDADDWWEPTFLEEMDLLIQQYPDAGIYGTSYFYVKNGRKSVRISAPTGYIDYCRVYADCMCMPLTSISVAIPRSVFTENDGFKPELKLGEDFDLWIRIALRHKVAFLDKPLANYNQDVDAVSRGIGRLRQPKTHMLWNLEYLELEEQTNTDYKQLIDNLRVYGLFPYYLSKEYRDEARTQLAKVDWSRQPKKLLSLYRKPVWYLRVRQRYFTIGSRVKQFIQHFV
ncbi:MAG: glycosyltransferase family 2 protein [Bacteroidales bacterium]|nr:glycosyltransferase family 2 protein [Candidatus Cryptobacteroides choladohippi]